MFRNVFGNNIPHLAFFCLKQILNHLKLSLVICNICFIRYIKLMRHFFKWLSGNSLSIITRNIIQFGKQFLSRILKKFQKHIYTLFGQPVGISEKCIIDIIIFIIIVVGTAIKTTYNSPFTILRAMFIQKVPNPVSAFFIYGDNHIKLSLKKRIQFIHFLALGELAKDIIFRISFNIMIL